MNVELYFSEFSFYLEGFSIFFAKHLYNNFFFVYCYIIVGSGGVMQAFPIQ